MNFQALGVLVGRFRARPSDSTRGQSLVEFTLILPIMLIILLLVGDFGRLFAAGITVESAARNAAEVAAAEYNRSLLLPSVDYAAVHKAAWSSVCNEASKLPNASPGSGGGECSGLPTVVCVHDGIDGGCGNAYNGAVPIECQALLAGNRPSSSIGGSESKFVEVRVCYRFNTIFEMSIPTIGGPLQALGGDFFLERARVFSVADY